MLYWYGDLVLVLSGENKSQKDVMNAISRMNIQVDNLCQFLPQDKVAEFAQVKLYRSLTYDRITAVWQSDLTQSFIQLSPPQLLERTQVAVGEKQMSEWHDKLITLKKEEKQLRSERQSDEDHLKTLRDRNTYLERDVVKMQQREAILKKIAMLRAKIPLAQYAEAKKSFDTSRIARQTAHESYTRYKNENAPMDAIKR